MLSAVTLALQILLGIPEVQGQTPAQATAPSQTQTPPQLPVDLNKIKTAVNTPTTLVLTDKNGFRFYSETVRPAPKFSDMVGSFDLFNGPTPHSGMTHREFVQSTRPKDLYSSAGFTPRDIIRWGILGYVEKKGFELLMKGFKELKEAKTEAERILIEFDIAATPLASGNVATIATRH